MGGFFFLRERERERERALGRKEGEEEEAQWKEVEIGVARMDGTQEGGKCGSHRSPDVERRRRRLWNATRIAVFDKGYRR